MGRTLTTAGFQAAHYRPPEHTIEAFEAAGAPLYNEAVLITTAGSSRIRVGRQFETARTLGKTHQSVLVFVKGDGKRAAAAVGVPEFGEAVAEEVDEAVSPRRRRVAHPLKRSAARHRPANAKKGERPPHPGEDERIGERRVHALDYRQAGASYRKLAQTLGVSLRTAWEDVQAELRSLRQDAGQLAEDVRKLELRRLDDLTLGLSPKARAGDVRAALALVRVQERRARLLGLDAAARPEGTGKEGGAAETQSGGVVVYVPENGRQATHPTCG